MAEQRVMSSGGAKRPGGAGSGGGKDDAGDDAGAKKGGKKKLLLVVAAVLVAAGAAWFFLKPAPAEAEAEPEPVPGEVLALEPVSINLADGHYLKLGLALQLVEGAGAHAPIDGSKALDSAITLFSGRSVEELADPVHREELKTELGHTLEEAYHHEVIDVYLTEYVTQ
ncbi:flagellar basal body-associated protein FliL [Quadrisphaera sp. DSM 44207]|uniref:flagellar basal body-associated FliL family protein n=1 Tax=Quadrisphaera sp. DSM 44207 TaxID=1881057 RepID=UPI0008837AD6|nr:flagellar basal body-associated FliL family protein [Quadrisphaera sp. DSM 44207]SDQ19877.1 flagellar FliL protein [Quadrisphaera sp. DSM 44207]